jgi:GTP-binding protein
LLRQWARYFFIVNISSAIFDRSAPDLESCPDESLPEFAFIGRSNVGKSSLLNFLAGEEGLARVSPTPGFTKMINIFTVNKNWRLVDLPGYGFAQGAKKDSAKFNKAVAIYLRNRPNLTCVFALIDSSLEPQEIDLEFIEWLVRNAIPFVLVFTKTDKISADEMPANIAAFMDCIAPWFEELPKYFTCSVKHEHGRQELFGVIDEALTAIYAESNQAPLAEGEVAPTRKEKAKAARPKRPNPARPW